MGHGAAMVHGLGCGGAGTVGIEGGAGAGSGTGGGSGSGMGTAATGAALEDSLGVLTATVATAALTGVGLSGEPQADRTRTANSRADFIGTAFLLTGSRWDQSTPP